MIYVTHDQIEALTLADRIAVMKDRVIQQLGTPNEIYRRPANRFVASFVGSPAMNFLRGNFAMRGGAPCFAAAEISIPLDGYAFDARPEEGASIDLGIRPEHVEAGGDLPAVIEMIEPMGSDQLCLAKAGDHLLDAAAGRGCNRRRRIDPASVSADNQPVRRRFRTPIVIFIR